MKAIYYEQFGGPIDLRSLPSPDPNPKGVVIQVSASGICLSDWHGWMGHDADIVLPHVPGHEFCGKVVAVGKQVQKWQVGDRVLVPFICACGRCADCQAGDQQVCNNQTQPGFTHWGSFAEYVAVDYADTNLVALPEGISAGVAASLGCRFATSFRAVVDQGQVKAGQWVAIHGCGGVGLSAIMIAQALGAQVIAIDIQQANLELAKALGAAFTIQSKDNMEVVELVREISQGGVHVSVDAIGHPDTLYQSIDNLKNRGRHVQIGLFSPEQQQSPIPLGRMIAKELEFVGSHGMQAHRYGDMLQFIQQKNLPVEKMIKERVALEAVPSILPKMEEFSASGIRLIDHF